MVKLRRYLYSLCGALALLLTACGGGGGGSSTPAAPPLADNGGVWVGGWTGTSGLGAGMKGSVVVELHQSVSDLTGYATVTNSLVLPDQSCSGTVNGATIQFGVVGHVDYTGTLSGASASGTFQDHDTSTGGTWSIVRYMEPFDSTLTPITDATGTWNAVSVSTMLPSNPPNASLQIVQTGQTLTGSITQGGSTYPILAGHVAGTKVWYAAVPSSDNLAVAHGDLTATTGSGGWVQHDASTGANPEDRGTWTATR